MMAEGGASPSVSATLRVVGFLSVMVFLINYTLEVMTFNHLYESRHFLLVWLQLAFSLWAVFELSLLASKQTVIPLRSLKIATIAQGLIGGSRLFIGDLLNSQAYDPLKDSQLGLAAIYVPLYLLSFLAIFRLVVDAFSHQERQRSELLQSEVVTRIRAEEALKAAQQDMLRSEIKRTQAEERQRMIHDLHDGFGSQLATARHRLLKTSVSQAEIAELLTECISDLYLVVDTLENNEDKLASALRLLRDRLQRRLVGSSLCIDWDLQVNEVPSLSPAKIIQVLRILQEAINNALKHAHAKQIHIQAQVEPSGDVAITVRDDGIGLPEKLTLGHGLNNMQRRARGLDGTISFARNASTGMTVLLRFPSGKVPPELA